MSVLSKILGPKTITITIVIGLLGAVLSCILLSIWFYKTNISPEQREIVVTTIDLRYTKTGEIDLDTLIDSVQKFVSTKLSDAKYVKIIYQSTCEDIHLRKGKLDVIFTEGNLWSSNKTAFVTIYLDDKKMEMEILRLSDPYPKEEIGKIATIEEMSLVFAAISKEIEVKKNSQCRVFIAQERDYWDVSFTKLDTEQEIYNFKIDAKTFTVFGSVK